MNKDEKIKELEKKLEKSRRLNTFLIDYLADLNKPNPVEVWATEQIEKMLEGKGYK